MFVLDKIDSEAVDSESQIRTSLALLTERMDAEPGVAASADERKVEQDEGRKVNEAESEQHEETSTPGALRLSAGTFELARQLHESLRLVLEPNKANQLQCVMSTFVLVHLYSYNYILVSTHALVCVVGATSARASG